MLIGTDAWSPWEVGFTPWLLVPRLVAPFVLALGLLLPGVRRTPRHAPVLASIEEAPSSTPSATVRAGP